MGSLASTLGTFCNKKGSLTTPSCFPKTQLSSDLKTQGLVNKTKIYFSLHLPLQEDVLGQGITCRVLCGGPAHTY